MSCPRFVAATFRSAWLAFALGAAVVAQTPAQTPVPSATSDAARSTPTRFGGFQAEMRAIQEPSAAAIDASGRILVVEPWTGRVRVFDASGAEKSGFLIADRSGRVGEPRGIAIAPDGRMFVSDAYDDTLHVLDARGQTLTTFGARGVKLGELHEPAGVAFDARGDGRVLVADTLNHRIAVFDAHGKALANFGAHGSRDGELDHPVDVAVDSAGACYVADLGNQRIVKFDAAGAFVKSWGGFGPYEGLFASPTGIHVHRDEIYVADRDNHRVQVFDRDGVLVHSFGAHALSPREGAGKLHYPNDVVIAPSGEFAVVVEGFENRCQVFGPETNVDTLPPGERNTASHYAGGCSVVGDLMAVLEPSGASVSLFDLRGEVPVEIGRFGRSGRKFGQFVRPFGVQFDATGKHLYVSDPLASRISMFAVAYTPGEPLRFDPFRATLVRSVDLALSNPPRESRPIPSSQDVHDALWSSEPSGLALAPNGELYVTDVANARVLVFDPDLHLQRTIGAFGDGAGQMRLPTSIAVSRDGERIFVVDARRRCLQAFVRGGGPLVGAFGENYGGIRDSEFAFLGGRPFGVCAGGEGALYVTNEQESRVDVIATKDGERIARSSSTPGKHEHGVGVEISHAPSATSNRLGLAEFYKPQGIACDARERLFVVDQGNHRFQILSSAGDYLGMWGARLFTEAARAPK